MNNTNKDKKYILLVDDEVIFANALSKKIQAMGYDVILRFSGEEAVDLIKKKVKVNLVLLDLDLGTGIDGAETAREILKLQNLPILFHTSHFEQEMVERVNNIKRYGYIIKNTGDFVLQSSLEMALNLFEVNQRFEGKEQLSNDSNLIQTKSQGEELGSHELQIIESRNFLSSIVENIPNMIFIKQVKDLRFVLFNRAGEHLLGYDRKDLLGKNDYDFFPKEQADFFTEKDRDVLSRKEQIDVKEEEISTPSGLRVLHTKKIPILGKNGEPEYLLGISEDITERIESEKKIKESIARYDRLTQTVPGVLYDYVLHKDGRSEMLFMSSKSLEIFETEPELLMKDMSLIWGMIHPDDLERLQNENLTANQSATNFSSEVRIITPSGKEKWIQINSRPNPVANPSEPAIWSGFIIDVTNRILAKEKIKSLLQEKELLLKEVHHRIKNNMLTITSLLFLQSETLTDPAAIAALNDASSRIQSMVVLYDKLYRSTDFKELSVREYISPLIEEIINNFPNHKIVTIKKSIDDFILPTSTLFPIGIMINEILTNAMKYAFVGRDQGTLTIHIQKVTDSILFCIHDDGVGFSDSKQMESYSGFGLQLVKLLAKQIRGKIKTEMENGTKFTLEFPVK
ncbi:MAG: PAS domain S-box protein [Leptospiraceae bacterium]|nr:PAS domain S-box protein [Leptospiraceae bacterium]